MNSAAWTEGKYQKVASLRKSGLSWVDIAESLGGVSADAVRLRLRRWGLSEDESPVAVTESDDGFVASSSKSAELRTLNQLIAECEIPVGTEVELERVRYNKWPIGALVDGDILKEPLFQVRADFKRIGLVGDFRAAAEKILQKMEGHSPAYTPVERSISEKPSLLVLSPADLHVGMLARALETGNEYNVSAATVVVHAAVEEALAKASPYNITEILVVLGNDILHSDRTDGGSGGKTTRGTTVDVSDRWPMVFEAVLDILVTILDRCRLVAKTRGVMVPGNHDEQMGWVMGKVLQAWYREDGEVTIECPMSPRSYVEWNGVLLGLTHGHGTKLAELPLLMATEEPEAWGRCQWWAWLTGHKHAARLEEKLMVRIHQMPSLAPEDYWHVWKGYRHRRVMEALLFSEGNYEGTFSVSAAR